MTSILILISESESVVVVTLLSHTTAKGAALPHAMSSPAAAACSLAYLSVCCSSLSLAPCVCCSSLSLTPLLINHPVGHRGKIQQLHLGPSIGGTELVSARSPWSLCAFPSWMQFLTASPKFFMVTLAFSCLGKAFAVFAGQVRICQCTPLLLRAGTQNRSCETAAAIVERAAWPLRWLNLIS